MRAFCMGVCAYYIILYVAGEKKPFRKAHKMFLFWMNWLYAKKKTRRKETLITQYSESSIATVLIFLSCHLAQKKMKSNAYSLVNGKKAVAMNNHFCNLTSNVIGWLNGI